MTNVLIFSGGRGSISLIASLKKIKKIKSISSIVNTYDDGKSSGVLRKEFNMPGPSDIRKIQQIHLNNKIRNYQLYKKIFDKRITLKFNTFISKLDVYLKKNANNLFGIQIKNKRLNQNIKKYLKIIHKKISKKRINTNDLSLINIIYAGAYFYHKKDINKSIKRLSNLFEIKEKIYSCGDKNLFLSGINNSNKVFKSEAEIVEQRSNVNMKEIFLTKKQLNLNNLSNKKKISQIKLNSTNDIISMEAKQLIQKSDIIIYSPGTPFSSLYPSYFCKGIGKEISKNKLAKKILITNIGSDYETPHFYAKDYVENTLKYLSFYNTNINDKDLITHILVNLPKTKTKSHVQSILSKSIKDNFVIKLKNFENFKNNGIHCSLKLKNTLKYLI